MYYLKKKKTFFEYDLRFTIYTYKFSDFFEKKKKNMR